MHALHLLLTCALALGPTAADELDSRLAELSSPSAEERRLAERWLSAHLQAQDFERLTRTLAGGDAEVRHRLARILASEERHFGLAARLAVSGDERRREIGARALEALAARWNPDLVDPGLLGAGLFHLIEKIEERRLPELLLVDLGEPVEANLARLGRRGRLPLGTFREVQSASSSPDEPQAWSGSVLPLLRRLAQRDELVLEGFGLSDDPRRRSSPGFLHLRSPQRIRTGVELLRELVQGGLSEESLVRRRRFLDALAATRWPAALLWLEERWLAGDEAAEHALLLAAQEGRVVSGLARPEALRGFLRRVDELFAAAPTPEQKRAAHHILDGLVSLPCLGAGGAALAPELAAGWGQRNSAQRWARLVLLEAWGCGGDGVDELLFQAAELLRAGPAKPGGSEQTRALLRQALRVLATLPPTTRGELGDAASVLNGTTRSSEAYELVALLVRSGFTPPDELAVTGSGPALDSRARLALLAWWLELGESEIARAHAASFLRPGAGAADRRRSEDLAEFLETFVVRGRAELPRSLLRVAQGEPPAGLERALFLAGALSPAEEQGFLARALADPSWTDRGADLALLGCLAGRGDERARAARDTLLALLGSLERKTGETDFDAVAAALERAANALFGIGEDRQARTLLRRLERARRTLRIRQEPSRPWPLPPGVELRPLSELDRRWP